VCGTCQPPKKCSAEGAKCYDPGNCTRECEGRECGDDLCGGTCGTCAAGDVCVQGRCANGATVGDGLDGDATGNPCPVGKVLYYGECRDLAKHPVAEATGCGAGTGAGPWGLALLVAVAGLALRIVRRRA
jgi:MYXO-CTERM domain-containing protein